MLLAGDGVRTSSRCSTSGSRRRGWRRRRPMARRWPERLSTWRRAGLWAARGHHRAPISFRWPPSPTQLLTGHDLCRRANPIAVLTRWWMTFPVPLRRCFRLGSAVDAVIHGGWPSSRRALPSVLVFATRSGEQIDGVPVTLSRRPTRRNPRPCAASNPSPATPSRAPRRHQRRRDGRTRRTHSPDALADPPCARRLALRPFAAMAFAWFSPTARGTAETMWHHAQQRGAAAEPGRASPDRVPSSSRAARRPSARAEEAERQEAE